MALELKVPPPVVMLLAGALMWGIAELTPRIPAPLAVRGVAGFMVALVGGVIAASAALAFRRAKTTIHPWNPEHTSALVTSGVFRFTRNPMYLGLFIVLLGWTVFLAAPWALLGPLLFVLYITRFQIAPEERILSTKFGETYAAYRARVRRWL